MRAILTFHSIDDSGSVLSYPPRLFARLLEGFAREGPPVLDLATLLQATTTLGVALTFDDGSRSVLTHAAPVVRDYAISAHLFLTTGAVGRYNRWPTQAPGAPRFPMLSWPELERLQASGFVIDNHTVTHPDLRQLDDAAVLAECAEADHVIRQRLGCAPEHLAYPYGHTDARIRGLVRRRYRGAFTTELRFLGDAEDTAALPRIDAFYLRSDLLIRTLRFPPMRHYLALRRALRRARER